MPVATPETYRQMIDTAKRQSFAFPAVNCVGSEAVSTPPSKASPTLAATASSNFHRRRRIRLRARCQRYGHRRGRVGRVHTCGSQRYPVTVALHTDHCPKDKLDTYVQPLLAISQQRVDAGRNPLFNSYMWDGSAIPVNENLDIAADLLRDAAAANIILEIEIGVVGGEEDGVEAAINDKLYTSDEERGRILCAVALRDSVRRLIPARQPFFLWLPRPP